MKSHTVLPACLLLLWIMTASVICQEQNKQPTISIKTISDAIELICEKSTITKPNREETDSPLKLSYSDENSGEYTCTFQEGEGASTIFVRFRTCDNCVELDVAAITGIAIGSLVATAVIGVAVYLTASQNQTAPAPAPKKRSDKQRLVPNEATQNDPNYQPLMHKGGQMYDVLTNRR